MAYIDKVTIDGSEYEIQDTSAQTAITTLDTDVDDLKSAINKYDDLLRVIKITDAATTMGDMQSTLNTVNTVGDHVVFDVASLGAGMYLCTIYINSGYYRIADLVTGFEGTGFYAASDLLVDIIKSGSSSSANHYTVQWDKVNATMTRLNAAASITTNTANFGHFGSVNPNYDNPFDSIYPWSGRKLCNIDVTEYMALTAENDITDCVTAWEGDPDFSYADVYGVWVYTPPFYGRTYDIGNYRYFDVSEENTPYNKLYPAMMTGRWFGCDVTLTIGGQSKTCNLPVLGLSLANVRLDTQHTYAKNYGASLTDCYTLDASILLYLVEYANMNSQVAVGNGVSDLYRENAAYKLAEAVTASNVVKISSADAASRVIPGAVFDIGTSSGGMQVGRYYVVSVETDIGDASLLDVTLNASVTATVDNTWSVHGLINVADEDIGSKSGYVGTNGRCNAYYRGEVLWGNKYQYVLGLYRQTGTGDIYCADEGDTDNYDALNTNYHRKIATLPSVSAAAWQYINALAECDGFSAVPIIAGYPGTSSAPVGDAQYIPLSTAGNTVCLSGGAANPGPHDGVFCVNWYYAASASVWSVGSRPHLKNPS